MNRPRPDLVYVISHVQKSLAFEWVALELRRSYNIAFILLNSSSSTLETFLIDNGIWVKRINFRTKRDYIKAFASVFFFLLKEKPQIVHAHLLDAQLLGLTAAWMVGVKKRIYTRHNSTYHHVYARAGVRLDRWSNFLSTHIISISQATYHALTELEHVGCDKIRTIYHGFDLAAFTKTDPERIRTVKERWDIGDGYPCIGVIARHIAWKGIQYIIRAFAKLLVDFPDARLVLANARGPYHDSLLKELSDIPRSRYVLIPFEEDVISLYAMFDLFVHAPVDKYCEAFGQTYVEALAAGIPSVFTRSGIAAEFIEHRKNAWVVEFCSAEEVHEGIKGLLQDAQLQHLLIENGRTDVHERFEMSEMMRKLRLLYAE